MAPATCSATPPPVPTEWTTTRMGWWTSPGATRAAPTPSIRPSGTTPSRATTASTTTATASSISPAATREDPECQDGVNNDGQKGTDFDGGVSVLGFGHGDPDGKDPDCLEPWMNREAASAACGLGTELAIVLPLLLLGTRRRRRA